MPRITVIAVWLLAFAGVAQSAEPAPKLSPLATAGPKPKAVEPPSAEAIKESVDRGIAFLLSTQNKDGSWGRANLSRPGEIYAPVPGAQHAFRAGTSALCISALIETGMDRAEVREAVDRAEVWALEKLPKLRRATPDALYNIWGHIYAIDALSRLHRLRAGDAARQEKIDVALRQQLERLERYEVVDGGWAYYDLDIGSKKPAGSSISFVTGAALVALDSARQSGFDVEAKYIDRAKASILRQRKPDFSYCYGEYLKFAPMLDVNRPGGSLGRSQCCNVALRLWGDEQVTDEVLITWLDRLFARNLWLDIGRKRPVPHESWFAVAGYFFYFGHYYAARSMDELPEDQRAPYQGQLAAILLDVQEKDGSWWDFPLYGYHQQYGTAFALMSLARCR